ncbi:hypothetical protein Cni_G19800 [Canna indica]|uniref:Uncharacterized protein n=1 Tax=Canna indica TaxID=4628 RepID=A0AAQ3QH90_9LILI|nr:hypothetical protein Cni_G19800 [Canna indica]
MTATLDHSGGGGWQWTGSLSGACYRGLRVGGIRQFGRNPAKNDEGKRSIRLAGKRTILFACTSLGVSKKITPFSLEASIFFTLPFLEISGEKCFIYSS